MNSDIKLYRSNPNSRILQKINNLEQQRGLLIRQIWDLTMEIGSYKAQLNPQPIPEYSEYNQYPSALHAIG